MTHHVILKMPERDLGNADVAFRVRRDGTALGTLKVSKGAVVWVPRDCTYGKKLTWSEFDSLMMERGRAESGRPQTEKQADESPEQSVEQAHG